MIGIAFIPIHIINLIFVLLSFIGYRLLYHVIPNLGCPWCVPWYYEPLTLLGPAFPMFLIIGVTLVVFHIGFIVYDVIEEKERKK